MHGQSVLCCNGTVLCDTRVGHLLTDGLQPDEADWVEIHGTSPVAVACKFLNTLQLAVSIGLQPDEADWVEIHVTSPVAVLCKFSNTLQLTVSIGLLSLPPH